MMRKHAPAARVNQLGGVLKRNTHSVLLIHPPIVFEPTCHMLSPRVVMRPMNRTPFFVPLVYAVEAYTVPFLYARNPGGNIYVVRNEDRLP